MMDNQQTHPFDEELSAYLDGELSAEQLLAVEGRLSSDPGYRRRLSELQRTWDLLDVLPRPVESENFTRSTIELVIQSTTTPGRGFSFGRYLMPLLLVGLIPLGAFVATWVYARGTANRPSQKLLQDVALFENFYYYNSAIEPKGSVDDGIEFLEQLSGLFPEIELDREVQPGLYFPEQDLTLTQLNQHVESYNLFQQQQRQHSKESFQQLSAQMQTQMRSLHEALLHHSNRNRLANALQRYNLWLGSVDQREKIELLDLSGTERIERIRQLQATVFDRHAVTKNEKAGIYSWFREFREEKETAIGEHFSPAFMREHLDDPALQSLREGEMPGATWDLMNRLDPEFVTSLLFDSPERMRDLYQQIDEPNRRVLQELTQDQQRVALLDIFEHAKSSQLKIGRDILFNFYNTLPDREARRLEQLPPEEMFYELKRMYQRSRSPADSTL